MDAANNYRLLADLVLVTHALIVFFIVGGQFAIIIGAAVGWQWVRNFKFRVLHLVAMFVVVLQAWLGVLCPLTTLEMYLRERGGDAVYTDSFIAHWLGRILYYDLPGWVFVVAYTSFGLVVAASWLWVRPVRKTI